MPLKDFTCPGCQVEFKDVLVGHNEVLCCPMCGNKEVQLAFSFPANYTISGDNSASVRPKRVGGAK